MSVKIKSTLNFVKIWPLEQRREEFTIKVVSDSKEEANEQGSNVITNTVCIEKNAEGQITYQVYFKSAETDKIFLAKKFAPTGNDDELSDSQMFNYIIKQGLRLVPTPLVWVDSEGNPVNYVTHDVYAGKTRYQGMSVRDIINSMVNGKAEEAQE